MAEDRKQPIDDRECWQEAEAKQQDSFCEYLRKEVLPTWIERLNTNPHPGTAQQIYEICLKMQFYKDMAHKLRQPRYARIELEAYKQLTR